MGLEIPSAALPFSGARPINETPSEITLTKKLAGWRPIFDNFD
jgi:hypothetical protein